MSNSSSLLDALQNAFPGNGVSSASSSEKKKSEYWLSVGYESEGRFISLSKGGIPLDNLEPERISNPESEFGQILLAQNDLLDQLKKLASTLSAGETRMIPGLSVQIRRIKGDAPVPEGASSKYTKKIF